MSENRFDEPQAEESNDHQKPGLDTDIEQPGRENMTPHKVGDIGGDMVEKMIAIADKRYA